LTVKAGAAALLLASVLTGRADLVLSQQVEGAGQAGEQLIRVKGGKARCDIAGSISVIVDRENGETFTLAHAQHGFVALSAAQSQAMIDKAQKARGSQEPPKLVATGRKEKVGGQACEIFTAEFGTVKLTYWLARDYPNYQEINAQLDIFEGAPMAGERTGLGPRTKDLPGLAMKITMENAGQKVTVSIVSVKEETVDPGIFNVPGDYRELPSLPPLAKP
jgi:hypothetical protein